MIPTKDNYKIQAQQAKKHFLTYDQQELIKRCAIKSDESYLYIKFLNRDYRICRHTGDMAFYRAGAWEDGNSFGEVMTILDWLCDSRADRYITGKWVNVVSYKNYFHGSLQDDVGDPYAVLFDADPEGFCAACEALGGEKLPGADISYAIELVDGLRILVQLWHGDEEFCPRLRCLWDENTTRYIRYETTWYAVGLLMERLKEEMEEIR